MFILLLVLLLISNAVSIKQDKSILFSILKLYIYVRIAASLYNKTPIRRRLKHKSVSRRSGVISPLYTGYLQSLLNRAYSSIRWVFNSPPKPNILLDSPLHSSIFTLSSLHQIIKLFPVTLIAFLTILPIKIMLNIFHLGNLVFFFTAFQGLLFLIIIYGYKGKSTPSNYMLISAYFSSLVIALIIYSIGIYIWPHIYELHRSIMSARPFLATGIVDLVHTRHLHSSVSITDLLNSENDDNGTRPPAPSISTAFAGPAAPAAPAAPPATPLSPVPPIPPTPTILPTPGVVPAFHGVVAHVDVDGNPLVLAGRAFRDEARIAPLNPNSTLRQLRNRRILYAAEATSIREQVNEVCDRWDTGIVRHDDTVILYSGYTRLGQTITERENITLQMQAIYPRSRLTRVADDQNTMRRIRTTLQAEVAVNPD